MQSELSRRCEAGVCTWTDPSLASRAGVLVGFSERGGGTSSGPFASLNLAHHVGDDACAVDVNRELLLRVLGLDRLRERLVTAEQVHGAEVRIADEGSAGAGAFRPGMGSPPLPGADAVVTREDDLPLLLLFADCVPVVLVAERPRRAVAVAHAGWRGAAAGVHVGAALKLCEAAGCVPADLRAYVGPHIGACHYQVGSEVLSQFENGSVTIAPAPGRLDLGAIVSADLERTGVPTDRIAALARCTAEHTDEFYSYRAEGVTGRHGAFAVVLGGRR